MILSFDNLPLNNDLLRGIYEYGLMKPSSLQFDLIQSFLNKEDIVIEKSFYLLEKYESVVIATLQLNMLEEPSLIVVDNKKIIKQFYSIFQSINLSTKHPLLKSLNNLNNINNLSSISSSSPIYIITREQFVDEFIDIDKEKLSDFVNHIFFMSTDTNIENYCQTHKNNENNQNINTSISIHIFDDEINKYDGYEKYYNNQINTFEPKKLKHYHITFDNINDKLNGNIIDTIYQNNSIEQSIIYLENSEEANYLTSILQQKDYPVSCFHENMTLEEQFQTVDLFSLGEIRMCICTDKSNLEFIKLLNETKMNFERITHVIHLDIPKTEKYLLRIPFHIETKHIFINQKTTFPNLS